MTWVNSANSDVLPGRFQPYVFLPASLTVFGAFGTQNDFLELTILMQKSVLKRLLIVLYLLFFS